MLFFTNIRELLIGVMFILLLKNEISYTEEMFIYCIYSLLLLLLLMLTYDSQLVAIIKSTHKLIKTYELFLGLKIQFLFFVKNFYKFFINKKFIKIFLSVINIYFFLKINMVISFLFENGIFYKLYFLNKYLINE